MQGSMRLDADTELTATTGFSDSAHYESCWLRLFGFSDCKPGVSIRVYACGMTFSASEIAICVAVVLCVVGALYALFASL
jgi:hypothetical protein